MKKLLPFCLLGLPFQLQAQQTADVLITNARVYDGTGNPWYKADVALKDGKIAAIGALQLQWKGATIINANERALAPGFIDVHTHIEGDEVKNPTADNFIFDGVTSVITGNCGLSRVDLHKYFNLVDSVRLSVNTASLIGHNDIRKAVMGTANRQATEAELQQMEAIMAKAMQDGAVGLSSGLIYIPGTYANTAEIIRLAKVAARYNGVYATHMRNEGDQIDAAIEEALLIGKEAKIPVQISHIKLSGQNNWGRTQVILQRLKEAREKEGIDVTIDQYPYTASSTGLGTLLPDEVLADGADAVKERLTNPTIRKQIIDYMVTRLHKRKLKHFSYAVVANYRANTAYNGKSIEEINLMMGRKHKATAEAETVIDMMLQGGAGMVFHGMSEKDVKLFMQYPHNMIASDASIRVWNEGVPHPRGYGSNARVLGKYVREEKVTSLEEAIRRMTSLPATKFRLTDRGTIQVGKAADLVLFDPKLIIDKSTFQSPHQYSVGMDYVWVNGVAVIANAQHTQQRPGSVLKLRQ